MAKQPSQAESSKPKRPLRKRIAFGALATVLILALLEGLASGVWIVCDLIGLFSGAPRVAELKEDSHCQYDEVLGWVNKPKTRIADFYGPGRTITINEDGVRGLDEYDPEKPQGVFRTICLGDSFTLGYGVDDASTFPYLLQQSAPENLQVVNMGQGGYSVGQSYLWLKRLGPQFAPDLVVCVFIVEDFRRLATDRTANGYATPRFELDGERLVISNVPVPEKLSAGALMVRKGQVAAVLKKDSALVRTLALPLPAPAPPDDTAVLHLGLRIVEEIRRECRELGCPLALVLTPTISEVFYDEAIAKYQGAAHTLEEFAAREGIPFRDLRPAFAARGGDAEGLFLEEQFRHYSRAGNDLVAKELAGWLPAVIGGFPAPTLSGQDSEERQ
jgi:hypothetical protein